MRLVIARTIVVLWIVVLITLVVNVFVEGDFTQSMFIIGLGGGPVWALQFILTGFINPLSLLQRALAPPPD